MTVFAGYAGLRLSHFPETHENSALYIFACMEHSGSLVSMKRNECKTDRGVWAFPKTARHRDASISEIRFCVIVEHVVGALKTFQLPSVKCIPGLRLDDACLVDDINQFPNVRRLQPSYGAQTFYVEL